MSSPARTRRGHRSWALAGVAFIAVVATVDLVSDDVILTAAVIAPFIAALGASTAAVAVVALLATTAAVALGIPNDIFFERDHVIRVVIVAVGGIIAVVVTRIRERRENELAVIGPEAQRMRLALEAGEMGTWRWDLAHGRVTWDTRLEALFGLAPGTFNGSFDTYVSLLHPDDRDLALTAVQYGMQHGTPWQFEHRAVWPDGSVHWLEGRGEPVRNESGSIVGATGVTVNIDARRYIDSQRAALLDAERAAREAAERSTGTLGRLAVLTAALSAAATVDDVAETMVQHGIDTLEADFGWFGVVDTASDSLVARAHDGYDPATLASYNVIPLLATVPATVALETRAPIFVSSNDDRNARFPQFDPGLTHDAFIVLPIALDDEGAGVLSFGFARPREFGDEERQYLEVASAAFAQALHRAVLFEAEQSSRNRLRTILEFSEALASLEEPEEVLRTTGRYAALRIGRYASVYTRAPDGSLQRVALAHRDEATERLLEERPRHALVVPEIVAKVAETGIGAINSDVSDDSDLFTATSELVVPIRTATRTHGVLLIGDDRALPLGALELELANDFGRRAGSATERTRLWQAAQRQRAIDQRIVEVLQGAIVPDRLPSLAGIELAASYRPADVFVDVGGDWYDAFDIEGGLLLMVGDVAGHGLEAATLMGRVRNALRAYAIEDRDPATLLRRSHEMLYSLEPGSMVTAVVGCFDPETRRLTYARAGHPPPIVSDSRGTRFLDEVNSTPLGTLNGDYISAYVELEPGSLVVLYTDGLIERRSRSIDVGLDQLIAEIGAMAHAPCRDVCRDLLEVFTADRKAEDDICVLVMRVP